MTTITLTNSFHGTSTNIRPRADGTISEITARRAHKALCGSPECICGDAAGTRDSDWRVTEHLANNGEWVFRVKALIANRQEPAP